jgi:hypothetical protein
MPTTLIMQSDRWLHARIATSPARLHAPADTVGHRRIVARLNVTPVLSLHVIDLVMRVAFMNVKFRLLSALPRHRAVAMMGKRQRATSFRWLGDFVRLE